MWVLFIRPILNYCIFRGVICYYKDKIVTNGFIVFPAHCMIRITIKYVSKVDTR